VERQPAIGASRGAADGNKPRIASLAADEVLGQRIAGVLTGAGMAPVRRARSLDELNIIDQRIAVVVVGGAPDGVKTGTLLRRLREKAPGAGHVLVCADADAHAIRRVLEGGGDGVVDERELEATLPATVLAVAAGLLAVPRSLRREIAPTALSHRERQVLALLVEGRTNSEIAARLYLAESTVKTHLVSAFAKLGVRSRRDAAALLLDPDRGLGALVLSLPADDLAVRGRRFARGAGEASERPTS
jgi:DNA-binding NarL/FixJ family response regulator